MTPKTRATRYIVTLAMGDGVAKSVPLKAEQALGLMIENGPQWYKVEEAR
jgi:hypothetical protein